MNQINIRFIPLILGAYIGVGLLMTIDAWVSVSLIDKNNPSTWPEMHPWVRIYCIPLLGTVLAFIALIIELIRSNIWKTDLASFISWIVLGLSYTTFFTGLIFSRFLPIWYAIILMVIAIALFNPFIVHYVSGRVKRKEMKI
jgi:uncharacterized membrane protein